MLTPYTKVLCSPAYKHVYPPSEDSFLFLDALEEEMSFLRSLSITLSIEVGSGSGIISSFLYAIDSRSRYHICIDISNAACHATADVIRSNLRHEGSVIHDQLQCSLVVPLLSRLRSHVDLLLFNPPYVPTTREEHQLAKSGIAATWSGGLHGREVIDDFLPQAVELLSPTGCLYLLLSQDNDPEDVHRCIYRLSSGRLLPTLVKKRRVNNELLYVFRYMSKVG
ncbi:HemK methyltransferase family member 2 [Fasciolopsis buskii]|uniref:Methyltransferase HEMK2 n=1 Tax=Fasciolopsis buskii TaxID=27845 RepID=A0A8E0VGX4_9TREM|nr:HemK methyltransferase family member 2 [Fasciolopsis buski]